MLNTRDLTSLCIGDVLIHPTRGAAVVEFTDNNRVSVELTERLDRRNTELTAQMLADGWRLAAPGGLFELSVRHPEEAASHVSEHPGDTLCMLADELSNPIARELAATWLVSRGMLPPGQAVSWWSRAVDDIVRQKRGKLDSSGRARVHLPALDVDMEVEPAALIDHISETLPRLGARTRFELFDGLSAGTRQALLDRALSAGDVDTTTILVRWPGTVSKRMHARMDRLLSSGHRELATRVAQINPQLVAPALLADALITGGDGLAGDVLAAVPTSHRSVLLMELLSLAVGDPDAIDAVEGLIDEHGNIQALIDLADEKWGPALDGVKIPSDGHWTASLAWLVSRRADSTVEMPSLHPTPLLRETGKLASRDAFPVSIALARVLARRHAEGRFGGIRGARLHRTELRVELGPAEPSTALDDVHDAMRLVADILIGRLAPGFEQPDRTVIAHLYSLAPDTPVDLVAVLSRALSKRSDLRPADGLALWLELEHAHTTDRLRQAAPPRPLVVPELGYDTHIGAVKSRLGQTNQDALFFHQHGPLTLLLVADGISTSTAGSGNLASALLVQAVVQAWEAGAEELTSADDQHIMDFQAHALALGNTAVCEAAYRLANRDLRNNIPMGTTAVMAIIRGGVAYISSVGDSRVYLVGVSGCALLTGDGNLRGDWIRTLQAGETYSLEYDGAALTSYVGHFNQEDQPSALPPQQRAVSLLPGEHLLLCSDGLTDFAASDHGDIAALVEASLAEARSLGHGCRDLVAAANAGGGGDNITVLVARLPG